MISYADLYQSRELGHRIYRWNLKTYVPCLGRRAPELYHMTGNLVSRVGFEPTINGLKVMLGLCVSRSGAFGKGRQRSYFRREPASPCRKPLPFYSP